jgi:aconitate hydratase
MTLENESDYELLASDDEIMIEGLREAVRESDRVYLTVKGKDVKIPLLLSLSSRQREILLAGGTLNYTKSKG